MGIIQRINGFLNYKIELDMDKKISRNKSLSILAIFVLCMAGLGYYVGEKWIWTNNTSIYEYEIKKLEKKLKDSPGSINTKAEMAMTMYLNGDTTKAIASLQNILKEDPQHKMALLNLGLIYTEQEKYQESIELLSQYVKQSQGLDARLPYLYLGQSYLALGSYQEAEKNLKESLARDGGNPVIHYYLGQTYEKTGNKKDALLHYEKALELNKDYTEANQALENLLKKGTE